MTIPSSTSKITATGTGSTQNYPYTFKIFSQSDLTVKVKLVSTGVETTLTITTDYTVTGVGVLAGGNVVLVNASQAWLDGSGYLLATYSITIERIVGITQDTSVTSQNSYLPEFAEKAYDKLTMIDQQQQRLIDNSLKLPSTETGNTSSTTLPSVATRANTIMAFDASGFPTTAVLSSVGANATASFVTISAEASLTNERVLTGTANQITVTDGGAGSTVTLSTPQNIHTAATPTFAGEILTAVSTPGSPSDGQVWNDSTQKALATKVDSINQRLSGCIFTQTAAVTIANTTVETTVIGTGVGTTTLPANFFVAGKTVRITLAGNMGTTGTPSIAIRLKYAGGSILAITLDGSTMTLGSKGWRVEFCMTCITAGATGTFKLLNSVQVAGSVTGGLTEAAISGSAAGSIDTTGASALSVTAQWSSASLSNTFITSFVLLEVLN